MKLKMTYVVAIAVLVMSVDRAEAFSPRVDIPLEGLEMNSAGKIVKQPAVCAEHFPAILLALYLVVNHNFFYFISFQCVQKGAVAKAPATSVQSS